MLTDFTIRNFRGIKELTLPSLKRVNLFVGKNGVGKTSVLEAVKLYLRDFAPGEVWALLRSRSETGLGRSRHELVSRLFHETQNGEGILKLGPAGSERVLHLRRNPDISANTLPPPSADQLHELYAPPGQSGLAFRLPIERPGTLVSDEELTQQTSHVDDFVLGNVIYLHSGVPTVEEFALLWEAVQQSWNRPFVVDAMRCMFPAVEDVDFVSAGGRQTPIVRLQSDGATVPLSSLGEGAVRIFFFAVALANRPQTLLIDEVENGIHYSVMTDVWRLLLRASEERNVQVYATTHSRDTVFALAEASNEDDHIVYRLSQQQPGEIQAVPFDNKRLEYVVEDELEIR